MTARVAPRGRPRPRRAAFTLLELMIVIVIIAVLAALLVPAVGSAIQTAREGEVRTEISHLETAIADFKAQFGMNPPSYIDFRLFSDAAGTTPNTSGDYLHPRTISLLRRLWPNINLAGVVTDLKTNTAKQKELDGSACLVFFLGGVVASAGDVPIGFSTNPRSPFATIGKRVGPFFEFEKSRLFDADPAAFDGYEGYLDTLPGQQMPYWYVTNDRYAAQETLNTAAAAATQAAMRPVYRQSATAFFNAQSFQIVSPGPDGTTGEHANFPGGAYGVGGVYNPTAGTVVDNLPTGHALKGKAAGDLDNLTNFASGRLVP